MQKFTISSKKEKITVLAKCHRQHIPYQTTLVGVTPTGCKRLDQFFKSNSDSNIYIESIPSHPRLVGYEII
jgi:hypothetical protein